MPRPGTAVNAPKYLIAILLRRPKRHQPSTQRVYGKLSSGPSLRLAHRVRHVSLNSARGKSKSLRDRLVAEAVDDQANNIEFAFGEAVLAAAEHGPGSYTGTPTV